MKIRLKVWLAWLKCTAKKMLKQRLDFPVHNKIETIDIIPKMHGQILLKQRLDFPFENKFKIMAIMTKI